MVEKLSFSLQQVMLTSNVQDKLTDEANMCCWILLAFAFAPRVALVLMWLLTDRISKAFGGILLPLVGFFLLPWATLAYTLLSPHGLNMVEIAILVLALGVDLGLWGGGAKHRTSG